MSEKNVDKHNRFRSVTVGFRASPEENELLNRMVALSGLSKQEYCYRKCMDRTIEVRGNPRVYKALKDELAKILEQLNRIASADELPPDLEELIGQITFTLNGLKGDDLNGS